MLALWMLTLIACGARRTEGAVRLERGVQEPSGLAASGAQLWTHPDSGNPPVLWAIDTQGRLLRELPVVGADNVDWEDITRDADGALWIADLGNNQNTRRDLALHRLAEPAADATEAQVELSLPVVYPEQSAWPDPAAMNFDAESLFAADGALYVLTKHRSDTRTVLYQVPALDDPAPQSLARLGEFDLGGDPDRYGGMATAADLSPDGQTLAVLSYHALFLFDRPSAGEHWLSRPLRSLPLDQDVFAQCEALAWVGEDLLVLNEAGWLFQIADPRGTPCEALPCADP